MAAPTSKLSIPASALATQAGKSGLSAGQSAKQLLGERILTHGVVEGLHVQDWGWRVATVPAGAPGVLDVNLLTALLTGDGDAIKPVAGKLVYLEIVQLTGAADLAIRRSAANAVELTSGDTDTLTVAGGHQVLVDVLADTSTLATAGLAFNATHKQLQLESTVGCQVVILAAVV